MRVPFLIAGLLIMSLLAGFGALCAAAPKRARREFGRADSPLNDSGDLEMRLCGAAVMGATVFFASLLYRVSFPL